MSKSRLIYLLQVQCAASQSPVPNPQFPVAIHNTKYLDQEVTWRVWTGFSRHKLRTATLPATLRLRRSSLNVSRFVDTTHRLWTRSIQRSLSLIFNSHSTKRKHRTVNAQSDILSQTSTTNSHHNPLRPCLLHPKPPCHNPFLKITYLTLQASNGTISG